MIEDGFTYLDFQVADNRRTVAFSYLTHNQEQDYNFSESLVFPIDLPDTVQVKAALRALHLALGISYYKIFVSPVINHNYDMSEAEAGFWNDVWQGGLGEFLYINKLSSDRLAKFKPQAGTLNKDAFGQTPANNKAILGIGGGKDSTVAGELLKELGVELTGFVMATGEQRGQAQKVADTMGIPIMAVERSLDKRLLVVQELPGAFKGHIPISLIFGLVGTVLALATDSSNMVVANEASASIPHVTWENNPVNHQWSKAFGFEQQLQQFIKSEICDNITYFSAIRPLTSVGVAKIFAKFSQYFEVFTSDNYVFRIEPSRRPNSRWSLESPKSISSYILLAPWLPESEMLRIFGRDFLNEPSIETLFAESIGHQGHPPLDCVGTVEELVLSLNLASRQNKFSNSYLMGKGREWQIIQAERDWDDELQKMLKLQPEQAFPPHIGKLITDWLQRMLT
jgi:hypothetical protein